MIVKRLIAFLVMVGLLIAACSSDSGGDTSTTDTQEDSAQTTDDTGSQSTDDTQPDTSSNGDTANAGAFSIQVSGAYETTIPYVTYSYVAGAVGRYDLRFFTDEDAEDVVLLNDVILVLPADIPVGSYPIAGEGGAVPMALIGDYGQTEASVFVNLAAPGGLPLAMNNPIEGEITIGDNTNGSLSASFSIVVGTGDESITISGQLAGLSGSILP